MLIQVVNKYLDYSRNNRAPKILCEMDKDHGGVLANIDDDDKLFIYCLACDYKNYIGLEHYQMMKEMVEHLIISDS